jgi:hypothetical protein
MSATVPSRDDVMHLGPIRRSAQAADSAVALADVVLGSGEEELVAVAGLQGQAVLETGFKLTAPPGELVLVFLQAGLGGGIDRGRPRGSVRFRGRRGGDSGSAGGRAGGWHACGERRRVMSRPFRSASEDAENIFRTRRRPDDRDEYYERQWSPMKGTKGLGASFVGWLNCVTNPTYSRGESRGGGGAVGPFSEWWKAERFYRCQSAVPWSDLSSASRSDLPKSPR